MIECRVEDEKVQESHGMRGPFEKITIREWSLGSEFRLQGERTTSEMDGREDQRAALNI
jgi:hypothetical protein